VKKHFFKLFGIIALVVIIGFTMAACDELDNIPTGKTPLGTPANVRVDDANKTAFTLRWDAVEGADSYTVDIDGILHQVSASTTSYDLMALTAAPKVYPIRIRAVAYNGDPSRSDSAYSDPLNVEPAEYIFTYDDVPGPMPSIQSGRSIARSVTGGGTITGLTNYGKGLERVVVPPSIGSVTITAIGDAAFKDNSVMSSIALPETLITIGAGALSGTNIASIVIPESVLNIGDGAFSNIIVLVVVVFVSPEPPELGAGVFEGSEAIETIVVPDGSGDTYAGMIEEAAPELAEVIEEIKEEKILIAIEVVQLPKTDYTAGEQFSAAGMTVNARYSDNTASPITNYTVMLQTSTGGFAAQSRALTVNDTVVRLSYTENGSTRTTDLSIKVTGQSEPLPQQPQYVAVLFDGFKDEEINLDAIDGAVFNMGDELNITVANAGEFSSLQWYYGNSDNPRTTGNSLSVELTAANGFNIGVRNTITVVVLNNQNIPSSKVLSFTVAAAPQLKQSVAVLFDGFLDEEINLNLNTNTTFNTGDVLNITVANADEFSFIQWYYSDSDIPRATGYSLSVELTAANSFNIGTRNTITVVVLNNQNIPSSKVLSFTVVE